VFIDTVLDPLRRRLPELRVVMEHITTEEGVAYAAEGGDTWPRRSPRIT
jgi:dihydroorotase